jgi:hypothetical protein
MKAELASNLGAFQSPLQSPIQSPKGSQGRKAMIAGALVTGVTILATLTFTVVSHTVAEIHKAADPGVVTTLDPNDPLTPTIKQIESFVADARGLPFKHHVKVTLLSDKAFRQRIVDNGKNNGGGGGNASREPSVLKALKLVPSKIDLNAEQQQMAEEGILGYYDFDAGELVVRGSKPTPFRRQVLAHELTHALQDQYFDLTPSGVESAMDESYLGLETVVEGDAMRIESRYFDSMTPEDQASAKQEEASYGGSDAGVPEALLMLGAFPYQVGQDFMETLYKVGDRAAVDRAFRKIPTTSEQLLHPESYLAGETADKVTRPPAEGKVFEEGTFGEMGLILMFHGVVPEEQAFAAAHGWGGDHYVAWAKGSQSCVRMDIKMDSAKDRSELIDALKLWAQHHHAAKVVATAPVRITACA